MANEKRLIDANEVERKIRIAISSWHCDCNSNAPVIARAMEDALQRVIYAPTVDAVEVVHGRWELVEYQTSPFGVDQEYQCSICGTPADYENITRFCPNCGAKMDGERKDNEKND